MSGFNSDCGTGLLAKLNTYYGINDPNTTIDTTQGYSAGSLGVNTATGRVFVCRSPAAGAAVWDPLRTGGSAAPIPGNWYAPPYRSVNTATAQANTVIRLLPMVFEARQTISQAAVNVFAVTAGATGTIALYAGNATGPTGPALASCNVSLAATGPVGATFTSPVQVEPGSFYWWGYMQSSATPSIATDSPQQSEMSWRIGSSTMTDLLVSGGLGEVSFLTVAGVTFGTVPVLGNTGTNVSTTGAPHIVYYVASVP